MYQSRYEYPSRNLWPGETTAENQRMIYHCPSCNRYGVEDGPEPGNAQIPLDFQTQFSNASQFNCNCAQANPTTPRVHIAAGPQTFVPPTFSSGIGPSSSMGINVGPIPAPPDCQQGSDIEYLLSVDTPQNRKEKLNKYEMKRALRFVDRCCNKLLESPCRSFVESEDEMEGWARHDGKRYWDSLDEKLQNLAEKKMEEPYRDPYYPCGPCAPCAPPPDKKRKSDMRKELNKLAKQLNKLIENFHEASGEDTGTCNCCGGHDQPSTRRRKRKRK